MERATLILTAGDVEALLSLEECIAAVEGAFGLLGRGEVAPPEILGVHVAGGGFHIKAASLERERKYFAAKTNANFPPNPERFGLPSIRGVIALFDACCGLPLAIMDSILITELRTAAASAVAVAHLSRPESSVLTIVGCGVQGMSHLRALLLVRDLKRVQVVDLDPARARLFATDMGAELGLKVDVATDLRAATLESDIVVTCTPSLRPIIGLDDIGPGTTIAAVGADNPEKHEIFPDLLAASKVVVDSLDQCVEIGDLHHAMAASLMDRGDVHAELGEVVAGLSAGRESPDEIIVFDSTGTALQDVASSALVYERALESNRGLSLQLSE